MFTSLPQQVEAFKAYKWEDIQPFYDELVKRPFSQETVTSWMADWAKLRNLILERFAKLRLANTQNTKDEAVETELQSFLKNIHSPAQTFNNKLTRRLLESGLKIDGMELPLKKMRAESDLFSEDNLPLLTQEVKYSSQFNRTMGSQTVEWEGESRTLIQMRTLFDSPDRAHRQEVWQKMSARQLEDRGSLNALWQSLFKLRREIAQNAGFDSYLAFRWQLLKRFDYTPQDSLVFHEAIAEKVVPAASRIYQQLADSFGVEKLRPWDVANDTQPLMYPKLTPMRAVDELATKTAAMFHHVGEEFGAYFETMRQENLLDLPNHASKAPGGYCTYFAVEKRPFILMNAVGSAGDVRTMLHEAGHAFHAFESNHLPYPDQRHSGHEFSEVASMAMELLASPYLTSEFGGFYDSHEEAARQVG
ncbi:MAG: M3 family metallopeptidase [Chloroflexota bacterium]